MALARLLRRGRGEPAEAKIPEGKRVYAVGDIHGRVDLLLEIHGMIEADADTAAGAGTVVYLGDYIDRGLDSREVIDVLLDRPVPDVDAVHLRGNHEEMLLRFLEDPREAALWLDYGGAETLLSYGVAGAVGSMNTEEGVLAWRDGLARNIPERHLDFLRGLTDSFEMGDYFFVHAGIRPGIPIEEQNPDDLLWIRKEFLVSKVDHGRVIVHGHSIRKEPEIRRNRIGIDTGAYASGVLTCLVLDGGERRLLRTGGAGGDR